MTSNNKIKTSYKYKGLPGKSQLYVISYDNKIRMLASFLDQFPFINMLVVNGLTYRKTYKKRRQDFETFVRFMVCSSVRRYDFVIYSRDIFTKSKIIETSNILLGLVNEILSMSTFMKKVPSKIDLLLCGINLKSFHDNVKEILNSIWDDIIIPIYSSHKSLVLKKLMERRRGISNVNPLKTDIFNVILSMLDHYDPQRSKIPFTSFVLFYTRVAKDAIIKEETHLQGDLFEDIDKYLMDYDDTSFSDEQIKRKHINIEQSFIQEQSDDLEYEQLLTNILTFLPFSCKEILAVKFFPFQMVDRSFFLHK